jgi:exodeoxyribonuclease VIII
MNAPAQAALECGVYPDVAESEYFNWKAVSNSRLHPFLKSAFHGKYAMDHPSEPTAAMMLGSAVDCLVFTPALFNERFAVAEQCCALTQKKEQCSKMGLMHWQDSQGKLWWRCKTHGIGDIRWGPPLARSILSEDQSSTAYAMAKSVLNHDGAKVLLDTCEETQLSIVWRENNLICKGRLDGLSSELKTVIDLKKTFDASPEAFSRSIATYGYHRQAAMYLRGCSYHGIEAQNYVIIAVENEAPFAVALYTLTERGPSALGGIGDSLSPVEYGNHELLRLFDIYERCESTNQWPSYPDRPIPISLPTWAERRIENA